MESIRLILTQFTDETMSMAIAILVLVFSVLVAYWYYNRRKFHQLSHQIPASVVKNYLDSIISNSNALKSSLFRGGGLDIEDGVPAIFPTSDLPTGGISVGGGDSEALAQKNAEIANLKSLLSQKDATIAELEKMLEAARSSGGGGIAQEEYDIVKSEVTSLKNQLEEANKALEQARNASPDDNSSQELVQVSNERDELKERLMEYEIIEEDLANLKKYQQENEELKRKIEELGQGSAGDGLSSETVTSEGSDEQDIAASSEELAEVSTQENPAADDGATLAAQEEMSEVPGNDGDQKSADELLSEFEKMLG